MNSLKIRYIALVTAIVIAIPCAAAYFYYATKQIKYTSVKLSCLKIQGTDLDYCEKLAISASKQ
ncbi:MAG: hypothetical protein EBZ49_01735 [Proteobacteria bacterium]|nr:hypothetical protein [Pseudomonadota bacterium]